MDDSWGGERTPESRRYSSSVRMVLRERLMPALSPMLEGWMAGGGLGDGVRFEKAVVCSRGFPCCLYSYSGIGKDGLEYVIVTFTRVR